MGKWKSFAVTVSWSAAEQHSLCWPIRILYVYTYKSLCNRRQYYVLTLTEDSFEIETDGEIALNFLQGKYHKRNPKNPFQIRRLLFPTKKYVLHKMHYTHISSSSLLDFRWKKNYRQKRKTHTTTPFHTHSSTAWILILMNPLVLCFPISETTHYTQGDTNTQRFSNTTVASSETRPE